MQKSNVDPKLVRTFIAVVHAGSFSAVARRDHSTPSYVSRQITALEHQLGVRLLRRTTRKLSLSEAGAVFFEQVSTLFEELEYAYQAISQFSKSIRGTLRVTVPPAFGVRHIAPLLPEFQTQFPELRIDVALLDRFVDLTGEGFDLAIRAGQPGSQNLVASRLASNMRCLCAAPHYLAKEGIPSKPKDLNVHNCLIFRYVAATNQWRFRRDGKEETVAVRGNLESNSADFLLAAVESGQGIALLPYWAIADGCRAGRVVRVLGDYEVTGTDFDSSIHALYESRRFLPAKVQAFLKFLQAKFSPVPPWLAPDA